jgi:NAD(P)-dependent dehydrogenase (short-subunit alcohol dehydrogenase family)
MSAASSDQGPPPRTDPHGDTGAAWLAGRSALVTGGGPSGADGGVGYAVCRLFARHGARVAVLDADPAAAGLTVSEIIGEGGDAHAVIADASHPEDCERAVAQTAARFGCVDTLVNNVACGDRALLFDVTPQRWDELLSLSLSTAWLMTRSMLAAMTGGGAVVNISSVAAGHPGTVHGVARAGIENFTRGAASVLGPLGIRVNCIQLGELAPVAACGRRAEGTCWDAAYAALFLASERARWISGHILTIDGGGPYRAAAGGGLYRAAEGGTAAPGLACTEAR